jgi:hypothetical protein
MQNTGHLLLNANQRFRLASAAFCWLRRGACQIFVADAKIPYPAYRRAAPQFEQFRRIIAFGGHLA